MEMSSIVPFDCVVIGAGPAGITASIYLARKGLDVVVITLDVGGQASLSTDVDNYTGYTMIPGRDLVKRFEEHLKTFNIKVIYDKIRGIKKDNELFRIDAENNVYCTKTVVIASGKKPRSLKVPGEDKFIGRGIVYYPTFDAPLFKGKPAAVVGGGNSALQAILELSKFAKKIHVINITQDLTGDDILKSKVKKIPFLEIHNSCKIESVKGKKTVESIEVMNVAAKKKFELKVNGIVVEIGLEPGLDFEMPKELKLNKKNEIDVDQNCKTRVPGLFAAGDITDVKWKQIIVAAGEGAKAGLSAYDYLMKNKEFLDRKYGK